MLKGVAILLMLFLHLFNRLGNVSLCHNLIFLGDEPLAYILSRAANPVAFFLILGGYGLFKVNEREDRHRWSRLCKLMAHYWLILAIFLTIGHLMRPDRYPGSAIELAQNVAATATTYNGEMWFLFPYLVLSICARPLFRFYARFNAVTIVLATLFIYLCTSFCISRYGAQYLYNNHWIYNPLLVFHLLFSFSLGAMAARERWFERISHRLSGVGRWRAGIAWGGVIVLVSIQCVFKYNFFYAFLIIALLNSLNIWQPARTLLIKLGDNSMNMWMIHSWFCYYLFRDFIYSFSYPLLIFIVLTVISYVCSLAVNVIAKPLDQIITSRLSTSATTNRK